MFFKKQAGGADWLVAGLGNPGKKYEGTRHNAGFDALDYLAREWGAGVTKVKFEGLYGQAAVGGQKIVLLKPQTFMNLSGRSIGAAADFFKIPAGHVVVLCDDVTQAPGKVRVRPGGSAGGHNGLKDIIARLGTQEFPRVRLGVGEKPNPEYDLAAWVLGKLAGADRKAFEARYPDVQDAVELILAGRLGEAQNRHNG
ncbi:peptidyl-tRNA hydrolase [Oscillospiraceae bacterium]|nr:peptidyl-tRNA hydrolase [Oscillospiraceae bacterium]